MNSKQSKIRKTTVTLTIELLTSTPGFGGRVIRMPVLQMMTKIGELVKLSWFSVN